MTPWDACSEAAEQCAEVVDAEIGPGPGQTPCYYGYPEPRPDEGADAGVGDAVGVPGPCYY
jgi:hypothetical protein